MPPRVVRSLHLNADDLERHNNDLQAKYARIVEREVRWLDELIASERDQPSTTERSIHDSAAPSGHAATTTTSGAGIHPSAHGV